MNKGVISFLPSFPAFAPISLHVPCIAADIIKNSLVNADLHSLHLIVQSLYRQMKPTTVYQTSRFTKLDSDEIKQSGVKNVTLFSL